MSGAAFTAAMATLLADANLGDTANYRSQGTGLQVSLRVIRSSPDRGGDAFGTELLQASDVLAVAIATLPALGTGDTFQVGAEILTVSHAERDTAGVAWRVFCQR